MGRTRKDVALKGMELKGRNLVKKDGDEQIINKHNKVLYSPHFLTANLHMTNNSIERGRGPVGGGLYTWEPTNNSREF